MIAILFGLEAIDFLSILIDSSSSILDFAQDHYFNVTRVSSFYLFYIISLF